MTSPRPWKKLGTEPGPDLLVARARFDLLENPRTGQAMRRTVLETPDWVNVVAITPDERIVFVRQYRFGSETVTAEIPGGLIDPGEEPLGAAQRELREETGFTSEHWEPIGSVEPNPAFLTNRLFHFLARDAVETHPPDPDPGEDIVVATLSREEVREGVAQGEIGHSLVLCALARVMDLSDLAAR